MILKLNFNRFSSFLLPFSFPLNSHENKTKTIEELEVKEKELSQSRWEMKRMEEGMASLIRENQRLCDERDEYLAFLHDSRATIASLRQENTE